MNEISPYTISPNFHGAPLGPSGIQTQAEQSAVKRYWWIIRKHQWLIGAIVVSAVTLAVLWYASRTPLFKANATIMIQPQAPQVLDVKELLAEQVSNEEHDYYRTQYDILKSRSLAARVIRDLGLQGNPLVDDTLTTRGAIAATLAFLRTQLRAWTGGGLGDGRERAADTLGVPPQTIDSYLDKLAIQAQRGTRLVVVGFTTPDAALSARIANAHVQTYIRRGLEMHAEAGHIAEEFLQQKQVEVKEKVERSEAALNKYRKDRGIVTLQSKDTVGESRSEPLMQRLTELNSELTKASGSRIELESQHELIRKGEYESLPAVISNPLIQKLKEEAGDLSVQHASMTNRFNPGYHPLDDLTARLSEAQQHLDREVGKVVESVESDYRAALASEGELTREIEQVKSQAIKLNDASLQDAILEREVEANRQLYKTILQRMNELSVSSDLPASNVSIVDRAVAPPHASGPGLVRVVVWTVLISLFGAITLALFLDSLDDTFKTAEEISRYLALPNLGFIPDFEQLNGKSGYGYRSSAHRVSRTTSAEQLAERDALEGKELMALHDRRSAAGDAYRAIRTSIMFSKAGGAPKTILITSAATGEGKTITAVNVAAGFAQAGGRTLLVDTDLRRSRCHEILRVQAEAGLTEVLVRLQDLSQAIVATRIPGLSLLGAGSLPPNPTELVTSSEMRALIEQIARQFEYVLFDSAPIIPVSDALGLATMVDGVLVVAKGKTSRHLVREACARLSQVGAKILGVVLNKVDPQHHAYYGYSHYYSRYYGEYESRPGRKPTEPRPPQPSEDPGKPAPA